MLLPQLFILTDRFSRRADTLDVAAAVYTTEGTVKILVNKDIPLWGQPAQHTPGQRSPVPLQAFAHCLPAAWS